MILLPCTFDGLMGKLNTFEVQLRIEDEEDASPSKVIVEAKLPEPKKMVMEEKNLAFKSSKSGREPRRLKGFGCIER